MNRRWIPGLSGCLLFVVLAGSGTVPAKPTVVPPAAVPAQRTVTLLLTHPVPNELDNVIGLVNSGMLSIPGLRVIGLYHADDWEDYSQSEQFLENNSPDWIELMKVDCPLRADKVFSRNGCSDQFRELFEQADGVLFTGGPDLPPRLYNEQTGLTTVIEDPPRHWFEISFLVHLLRGFPASGDAKARKGVEPLLAGRPEFMLLNICLGMQSLNVALGGTLIQDIPSEVYGITTLEQLARLSPTQLHRSPYAPLAPAPGVGWAVLHPVRFQPDDDVSQRLIPEARPIRSYSSHHQAIEKLGQGLKVIARSLDDKIVEAVVHERFPNVLGLQFHPEKRQLFDASLTFLEREGAVKNNFLAEQMAADRISMRFHERLWRLVAERLQASSLARAGTPPDE